MKAYNHGGMLASEVKTHTSTEQYFTRHNVIQPVPAAITFHQSQLACNAQDANASVNRQNIFCLDICLLHAGRLECNVQSTDMLPSSAKYETGAALCYPPICETFRNDC